MTRSTLWCALALLAPLASGALAAEHFCGQTTAHPIDKALAAAAERSGGVTVDLRDAQSAAYAAWDKELNRIYAQALKAAGPTRRPPRASCRFATPATTPTRRPRCGPRWRHPASPSSHRRGRRRP